MSNNVFTTAQEVEAAFYEALARADLEQMMAVWSEEEDVVCILPGGTRVVGLAPVREAWRQVFSSDARLKVAVSHQVVLNSMLMTVHNVFEHVSVEGDDQFHPPLIATNIYVRGARGWRMLMHHASPGFDSSHLSDQELLPRVVH